MQGPESTVNALELPNLAPVKPPWRLLQRGPGVVVQRDDLALLIGSYQSKSLIPTV